MTIKTSRYRPKADPEQVRRMYEEGLSQAAIARVFGVTPGRVWQILRGYKPQDVQRESDDRGD